MPNRKACKKAGPVSKLEWYVIQIRPGQERKMCEQIEAAYEEAQDLASMSHEGAEPFTLDECFEPRYRTQKKMHGEWRDVERALMPGYVIAVTDDPGKLARLLRGLADMCKLVTMGETYVPLTDYEREWLEANTQKGNRVVPMSFGYREDDVLTVTEGPLKGHEGRIVKINRASSLAQLEFHVGQFKITTTVGLGIVPKNEA